jgi:Xaa-Pro aminopeptidase
MTTKPTNKSARLLYGSSEHDANVLYLSKAFVPDEFISIEFDHQKIGVFSPLEYARMIKESDFDKVLSLDEYQAKARKAFRSTKPGPIDIIKVIAKEHNIDSFLIPANFPAGLAFQLKKSRIGLQIVDGPFFPAREIKTKEEVQEIKKGNAASTAGILAAEAALRRSKIKGNELHLDGYPLTSERLRFIVDVACLEMGAMPKNTIVAGGLQACDPHCIGSGPLRPNELIIVDVFPRLLSSGYHGDMTRTFLKGKATDAQKKLVLTVQKSQKLALEKIKAGIPGANVHNVVVSYFESKGYITKRVGDAYEGFFHGTGHGLGLDVHEAPRVNGSNHEGLKLGTVVTVEPGLYYPEIGGCRIEDVVWVQKNGYEILSNCHYAWHLE